MIHATQAAPARPSTGKRRHRLNNQYEHILSQLKCLGREGQSPAGIGVLGLSRGVGASTIAANLSVVASRTDVESVLLVDAAPVRASLHKVFKVPAAPGFSEAVSCERELSDCIHPTQFPRLSVMPGGNGDGARPTSFSPTTLAERLRSIYDDFDLVIVDLAAAGESLSFSLAKSLGGVVLVLEAERSRRSAALRAKQQLEHVGVNILGVVLNKRRHHMPSWLYRAL